MISCTMTTKSTQSFHAAKDSSGKITVTRTSEHGGIGGTITFDSVEEMRRNLTSLYRLDDIDRLMKKLTSSGSVDFKANSKPR
jgi:hypothetical protein